LSRNGAIADPISAVKEGTMGSGDARTRRGKLFRGSHGKTRPKGKNKRKPLKVTAGRAGRGKAH
jgi:ribosomal small subunit protein bTHX